MNQSDTDRMNTRARHRRDTEILAASHAGVPARVIALGSTSASAHATASLRRNARDRTDPLRDRSRPQNARLRQSAARRPGGAIPHASHEARVDKRAQVAIAFGLERCFGMVTGRPLRS